MKAFDRVGGAPRRILARNLDPSVLLPVDPNTFHEVWVEGAR